MKLLLDTYASLWCLDDDPRLSALVRSAVEDTSNTVYVSSLAIVEIALKVRLGKLKIQVPFDQLIATVRMRNDVQELPLTFAHAKQLFSLPLLHCDAFDRMLIAQALVENMTLATADAAIAAYNIPILW